MNLEEKKVREEVLINNSLDKKYFEKNFFVEAGAGAGKTTIITERIVNQVKAGYDIDKIVVITFTNKAANEIRDRIIMRINEEVKVEKDKVCKDRLLKANESIGKMQMSTIHSFCMKILREQSFASRLHFDVQLVEGEKELEEKRYFFNEWYDDDNGFKNKSDIEKKLKELDIYSLYKYLFDNFCSMTNLLNDEDFVIDKSLISDTKYIFVLKDYKDYKELKDTKDRYENEPDTKRKADDLKSKEEKHKKDNKEKGLTQRERERLDGYINTLEENKRIFEKVKTKYKWEKIEGLDFKKKLDEEIDEKLNVVNTYIGTLTVDILQDIVRKYRETNRNVFITNNDLLRKTRKLFAENPEIKEVYKNKISCVYVDEFQDTNQVQIEFLTQMLSGDKGKLRKGSIFVVGDPKQSIYKFQGSDLQAYNRFKTHFDNDEIIVLNWNFRSNNLILDFVNSNNKEIFNKLDEKTKPFYTIDYKDMKLPNDKNKVDNTMLDEKKLCGVYTLTRNNAEYDEKNDSKNVCLLIKKLVVDKYNIITWDNNEKKYKEREIKYKDFLVISPNKTGMKKYIDAFNDADIPTQFTLEMSNSDIKQLYRFLYSYLYITNPYYDKAKYAFVDSYFNDLIMDLKSNDDVKNVLNVLKEKTKPMDNFAKAKYLVDNYNLLFNKDTLNLVESKNLQIKLQQMYETVISDYDALDLIKGFYEYIETKIERDITLSENEDVVRFMNLHKVKGLQGNIVICVNRDKERKFRYDTHHEFDKNNKVQYYYSASTGMGNGKRVFISYGKNSEILKHTEIEEMAEMDRLAYVECTRAKDVLIFMPCIINEKKESFCNYGFKDAKSLDNVLKNDEDDANSNGNNPKKTSAKKSKNTENNAKTKDEGKPQTKDEIKPWTKANKYEFKDNNDICSASPSDFEKSKGISKIENSDKELEELVYGNIYGTIMHRGFELLVNEGIDSSDNKISYIIDKAILENTEDLKYAYQEEFEKACVYIKKQLKKVYSDFAKNEGIIEILTDGKAYTEYHFNLMVDREKEKDLFEELESHFKKENDETMKKYFDIVPSNSKKMYITGQADLIVIKDRDLYIIDYKSDKSEGYGNDFEDGLKNAYKGQLELYNQVMKLLFENKSIHKYIYNNNKLIEI